jgi:hypothetical protein
MTLKEHPTEELNQTTLEPAEPEPVPPSLMFSATVFLDATVLPSPNGHRADLELNDGTRVRVSPPMHHRWLTKRIPAGRHLVRLYLRVERVADARLASELVFTSFKPLEPEAPTVEGTFEVLGQVVRLDSAEGVVIVRIYPLTPKVEPFLISALASLEVLEGAKNAQFVRVTGIVRRSKLVARLIEPIVLSIPERWKDWKPVKRKPASSITVEGAG